MTNEKAFEHFTDRLSVIKSREGFGAEYIEATEVAIQAIEKQIPKKPIDVQTPVVKWGVCPNCKGLPKALGKAQRVFGSMEYCFNCGQKLDWTEETK